MALKHHQRTSSATAVELHIEKLVLHGFPAVQRARLSEAIREELVRRLSEAGGGLLADRSFHLPHVDAGKFQSPSHPRPDDLGRHIANQVFSEMQNAGSAVAIDRQQGQGGKHHA